MDVASVVAAVGSFVVSEKVIKAKATVVVCVLGVVAYDLTLLSTDPVSLRVYRGPAILGLAFICIAYSLRTWRRNNCACDELLFLPDTMYYKIAYRPTEGVRNVPLNLRTNLENSSLLSDKNGRSDDLLVEEESSFSSASESETEMIPTSIDPTLHVSSSVLTNSHPDHTNNEERPRVKAFICQRKKSLSLDQISNSTDITLTGSHDKLNDSDLHQQGNQQSQSQTSSSQYRGFMRLFFTNSALETNEYSPSGPTVASAGLDLLLPVLMNFHLFMMASRSGRKTESSSATSSSYNIKISSSTLGNNDIGVVSSTESLHILNESSSSISNNILNGTSENDFNLSNVPSIPPQVLPIIFLSILLIRSIFPRKGRTRFWKAIFSSMRAPFQSINFRDAFLAEVLTSMTR